MPWSKIVKRYLQPDHDVQQYILEEVELRAVSSEEKTESRGTLPVKGAEEVSPPVNSVEVETQSETLLDPMSPYEEGYLRGMHDGEAQGFAKGKVAGFVTGEVKGFGEGRAKGFAEGKTQGFAEGETKGFADGKAQGLAEGQAEGLSEGKAIREADLAEFEQTRQLLLRFIEDFKYLTETYVSEAEHDLLQMVLALAQKVIKKELTQDNEALVTMIQAALKKISPLPVVALRVHPKDVERLAEKSAAILESVEGIENIKMEPDTRLTPGDVLLEIEDRILDLRPEMQLAEIEKKLLPQPGREEGS